MMSWSTGTSIATIMNWRLKEILVQGSAKRWVQGCVNAAGKAGRSGKQQQEQSSLNHVKALDSGPVKQLHQVLGRDFWLRDG